MSHERLAYGTAADIRQAIERQIMQRTWGRVHRLHVDLVGDRVIVFGCTSSFHSKQLALEGVLDVMGSTGAADVELNIEVMSNAKSSPSNRSERQGILSAN